MPILSFLADIHLHPNDGGKSPVRSCDLSPLLASHCEHVQVCAANLPPDTEWWEGRGADRHGEEEQGRNKKGEPRGLLSDKTVHATERRGERNGGGVLTHLHLLYIYYFYLLTTWCVAAAPGLHGDQWWSCLLDSPAHFLSREPLVARPRSCLIPISLLLLTLVCLGGSLPLSPQWSLPQQAAAQSNPTPFWNPSGLVMTFWLVEKLILARGQKGTNLHPFWGNSNF